MRSQGFWLLFVAGAASLVMAGSPTLRAGGAKETTQAFRVTVDANINLAMPDGKTEKTDAITMLDYTFKRSGKETTVFFNNLKLRATQNGAEKLNATMSKAKFTQTENGQTKEIRVEDAPDQLKDLMSVFDTPICKLELDEAGKEINRTVIAGAAAKALLAETGILQLARLFHPPLGNKDSWQAPAEIYMDQGATMRGTLTYEKAGKNDNGQTLVKVSGTLTNDGKGGKPPLTIKDGQYVVKGNQVYDHQAREWVAGDLNVEVSFAMEAVGIKMTAKGTMKIKLEKASGR